jgi:hypothetical protein
MNGFPSKEAVERLRKQYPAGTRVEVASIDDPHTSLRPGDRGSIEFFDGTGTAFVKWDNGSGLGLAYGHDHFKKIDEPFKYADGAHFWRDTAASHGLEEAFGICGRYLEMQMKLEHSKDERQFCREMFAAMHEASVQAADPAKIVYPYPFEKADEREEVSHYHASRGRNTECARAIDAAISGSGFAQHRYNLDLAAMKVLREYGFERVQAALMRNIHEHEYDGRYSDSNKRWAQGFNLPDEAFSYACMNAHPILIEDFATRVRELYKELGAERFALPGRPESGTAVHGYEIARSIFFNNQRGFAIGHNPDAPSPFVCWQFTTENSKREFYWGHYTNYQADAQSNYLARVAVHMDDGVKEIPNPLAAAEMSAEQNCNAIDGAINNEKNRLGLTDGQTNGEISALAPDTLPAAKPSVMKQIREAKAAPKQPRKAKSPDNHKGDIEL